MALGRRSRYPTTAYGLPSEGVPRLWKLRWWLRTFGCRRGNHDPEEVSLFDMSDEGIALKVTSCTRCGEVIWDGAHPWPPPPGRREELF